MLKYILLASIFIVVVSASNRERLWNDTAFLRQPYYRSVARSGVADLAQLLERDVARGQLLPTRLTFPDYLQKHGLTGDRVTDPWGTPYYLEAEFATVRVASAGRDGVEGTEDDIFSERVETGVVPLIEEDSDSGSAPAAAVNP